ncbi:exocyst complex component Sec10-like protein [Dichotomocladium elegans]|nr:exocyst complex component Sec10-like protein [Dichotomocladium elegans]
MDSCDDTSDKLQAPLKPVIVPKTLAPDILIRIFKHLPVPSLTNVALASRRFKVLAYDDEIWDAKLHLILDRNAMGTTVPRKCSTETNTTLMDVEGGILINNKPLSALIPGLLTDPYHTRARAKSTGQAREQFKEIYLKLLPYYVDLRNRPRESKVLKDYGKKPEECGKLLNMLVGFGACHVVDDWKQLNAATESLCQYFESASLHQFESAYDKNNTADMKKIAHALIALNGGAICIQTFVQKHPIFYDNPFKPDDNYTSSINDLEPFKKFMGLVTDECRQQSYVVAETFPEDVDVYYTFVDRVLEDVVADYVNVMLGIAQRRDRRLYLHTISVILNSSSIMIEKLTDTSLPRTIDHERGINMLFKLFIPFMDNYLYEEQAYVKDTCKKLIDEWNNHSEDSKDDEDVSSRLSNQTRETFKRNYLSAFKKVIALPVDLVSSAATTIASPFQRVGTRDETIPPATPRIVTSSMMSGSGPPSPSSSSKRASFRSTDAKNQDFKMALRELDVMQDLLSLETVVQLIHVNKDAERRVERFLDIGFPKIMHTSIKRTYEQIFVELLRTISTQHIQPAFDMAVEHLTSYTPSMEAYDVVDVPPLTEFFEMVHIGDVIQQMVQLYYDDEITKYVDKMDFINEVNKEKKNFERTLDDCVANGMDRGITVLLSQVEYILAREQRPEDYNPPNNMVEDLKPTKACQDAIECLRKNTSMLIGASEKSTMDLFISEVGRRFGETLSKHLKTQTVNEQGGFRYMSDMNAYHNFIASLRQSSVTPYFSALQSLANIYIISSAPDIKNVIHDLERYHGLLKTEDLLEFAACRSDWPTVKKVVMRDMTDCNIM